MADLDTTQTTFRGAVWNLVCNQQARVRINTYCRLWKL